jgi:hypothetical protein
VHHTTAETIPAEVPYLFADPALVASWNRKLAALQGFRIGINWRGRKGDIWSQKRDVPIELFVMLSHVCDVRLVSLQKEQTVKGSQARNAESMSVGAISKGRIVDLGEFDTQRGAFMDTAAIMMNLDLVITSDTSVAHVAGALGVPVWVALPQVADWRWLLDRSDSPWYPTMRLFRQKRAGDWESVFEEIASELRLVAGAKK